ncbi:LTA synthase family protein [Frateuria hangzhouensis]|uniref:LTA synthase family protein n=1 Tax=Frateuria hangzhouensis TaxID=2995589 RepID=UPI0022609768|nr:LTA synthase family protein [Frateuria sp. STR12]MCX7514460.1 LTA synthase family protein [Frateuria sp. STR12]
MPPFARSTMTHWRPPATRVAAVVSMSLAFALLTGLMDGGVGVTPLRIFDQARYPLANALPGLLAAWLLLALTRRLLFSFGLVLLFEALLYQVNALKVANLGNPLMPADFQIIGQLRKGGAHLLVGYLPHSPWPYLGLLAGIALIVALWRLEPPLFARRTRGKRLASGAVSLVLLASLLGGITLWNKLYNARVLWLEPWSATSTANHSGLVSSLMLYHLQYGQGQHKANPAAAKALIAQTRDELRKRLASLPTGGERPDIVVVQSESFFDPAIMRGYQESQFTPNLDRLERQGSSGALHVPTFGGGTIRTEFEMLTGLSLRYFDELQFPYLTLNQKVVPSLVRTLRAHGYTTTAIHGNDPAFWNRTAAFKAIGFDRFVSKGQFPKNAPNDGKYMADSAMTDEIMRQLRDAGPPQFLFAISIEAHGPYDVPPTDTDARDAIEVPAGITGRDKLELQTYLYHAEHADAELGRLAKLLARRARPTLLLFYGDHLPALTNSFHATGFVDGGDMLSEPGVWLLVDPRNPGKATRESLASWMLPGKLLEAAGIRADPYYALTQVLAPQLAALTRAPGAPQPEMTAEQKVIDQDMASVALLRMKGKLDALMPPLAASAAAPPARPQARIAAYGARP